MKVKHKAISHKLSMVHYTGRFHLAISDSTVVCRDGGGCLYPVIQWKTAASVVQALKAAN